MSPTSVFVSGANGFVAQHVIKLLLAKGYAVVGSVRSATKGDELKELVKSDKFSYEIISELGDKPGFDAALKKHPEVTGFMHIASPVGFTATDIEKELIRPAVDGTVNALKAITEYAPQINKVVITGSVVSVFGFGPHFDGNKVYTEDDWNPITYEESLSNPMFGYFVSKKFAELAALEFIEKEKPNFDTSFVIPCYVFGPQAYGVKNKKKLNLSNEIINTVVKLGKDDKIESFGSVFVDVRDVARAHLVAFENKRAVPKRLLLISEKFSLDSIAHIINEKFPDSSVPKGDISKDVELEKSIQKFDNSKTKEILGFDFIPLEKTVEDTVTQVL
ncbi:uncharacterized protein SPAPADRAFT_68229 [Spathaspora passalidarum NRRL Y-27907]|uniref:NAD-dependent epimerase/dehydratase domain-containing protein n=1 Tax=Spathaspora passalidarum (strain NRRL Y-27907 / 11-Y1) TaxID=619300 RepID=G3AS53_SPAPN|nr:uncharacterized protein SPAPADRAFT_68229 [Spathaspora passalidarum NRRL Y-27907]EGW31012.1 hypothetical protein SPAPADRAFT_68229 [Spathaspora passalidarum NRRL Y-27907]